MRTHLTDDVLMDLSRARPVPRRAPTRRPAASAAPAWRRRRGARPGARGRRARAVAALLAGPAPQRGPADRRGRVAPAVVAGWRRPSWPRRPWPRRSRSWGRPRPRRLRPCWRHASRRGRRCPRRTRIPACRSWPTWPRFPEMRCVAVSCQDVARCLSALTRRRAGCSRRRWGGSGGWTRFEDLRRIDPAGGPGHGPAPWPRARGRARRGRDDVFKMIDAYVVSNLQESLELTDDQYVKILPLVKRLQTDRREFGHRRMQAMQELRRLLAAGDATEARVAELLKEVKSVETEEPGVIRRDREAIDAILSPVQQAKFRILEIQVERRSATLMTRLRQQQRPAGRPRGEAPQEPDSVVAVAHARGRYVYSTGCHAAPARRKTSARGTARAAAPRPRREGVGGHRGPAQGGRRRATAVAEAPRTARPAAKRRPAPAAITRTRAGAGERRGPGRPRRHEPRRPSELRPPELERRGAGSSPRSTCRGTPRRSASSRRSGSSSRRPTAPTASASW